ISLLGNGSHAWVGCVGLNTSFKKEAVISEDVESFALLISRIILEFEKQCKQTLINYNSFANFKQRFINLSQTNFAGVKHHIKHLILPFIRKGDLSSRYESPFNRAIIGHVGDELSDHLNGATGSIDRYTECLTILGVGCGSVFDKKLRKAKLESIFLGSL
ncbi:hypothetical protein AOQ84DRAFT_366353, partial [Glonium stellatum]